MRALIIKANFSLIFAASGRDIPSEATSVSPSTLTVIGLKTHSHCAIFPDCDCDSFYHNKCVVQDSMEVFTLCDCDNITYIPLHTKLASRQNIVCDMDSTIIMINMDYMCIRFTYTTGHQNTQTPDSVKPYT